jgi:hypothetical protein
MLEVLQDVTVPIELGGLVVSEAGGLARREPKLPLVFEFDWRDVRFQGEVARVESKLILRLVAKVTVVPFTAEDLMRRAKLLSLLKDGGDNAARTSLILSNNNALVLLREMPLPPGAGLTAQTLVTQTATALLSSAPHLDLMVEFGIVQRREA